MRRGGRPGRTGRGRTAAEDGRGRGSGASGRAPWTGLAAPSGKPARVVKAAGATKKLLDPPSQTRAPRAQCAPRQGAVGASRQDLAEEDEKALHKVLTFPETALECAARSEEHTSELQSLMRISYAVFCLKKKNYKRTKHN